MSPALLSLLTFVSILFATISIASLVSDLFLRDRARVSRRLDEEFRKDQKESIRRSSLFKDLHKFKSGELDANAARKPDLRDRLEQLLEQSGLTWTLQKLIVMSLISSVVTLLPGAVIQRSFIFAIVGALVGSVFPLLYVKFKRKSRMDQLCA